MHVCMEMRINLSFRVVHTGSGCGQVWYRRGLLADQGIDQCQWLKGREREKGNIIYIVHTYHSVHCKRESVGLTIM